MPTALSRLKITIQKFDEIVSNTGSFSEVILLQFVQSE